MLQACSTAAVCAGKEALQSVCDALPGWGASTARCYGIFVTGTAVKFAQALAMSFLIIRVRLGSFFMRCQTVMLILNELDDPPSFNFRFVWVRFEPSFLVVLDVYN